MIRRAHFGWTILVGSCELAAYARELEDEQLTALLDEAGDRAAAHVGASVTLLQRIRRGIAWRLGKQGDSRSAERWPNTVMSASAHAGRTHIA
jgi:hypothetical protein